MTRKERCGIGAPFFVNGPSPLVYNGGLLGYGVDGIEIEIDFAHHDVMFDVAGGTAGKPGDVQIMNHDARISTGLTAINFAILKQAISNSLGGQPEGSSPASGLLLGLNGFLRPLSIPSPLGGMPWVFTTTYITSPLRVPLGTVNSIIAVTFRAIAYAGGADALSGVPLYSH